MIRIERPAVFIVPPFDCDLLAQLLHDARPPVMTWRAQRTEPIERGVCVTASGNGHNMVNHGGNLDNAPLQARLAQRMFA
jgi:hypothetical protein